MKILIVRVSSLGDVLHNLPMVDDLLRHVPQAQIDWVVEEAYVDLVRLNPGVRSVIPFALRRWRKALLSAPVRREIAAFRRRLRETAYDLVFDTQGLLKTGVVMGMARLAPGGRRIGLANGTEGSGYEAISRLFHTGSVAVPWRAHAVARGRLVAAAALHYSADTPARFNLQAPHMTAPPTWMPQVPYAVFFHATARAAKQWAPDHWVALANYLEPRAMPILLPWGSPAERSAAQALAARIPNAIVLPPLSMMEAILLAQRAALVVGVDTGLTHIAAAYERPTIELYIDSPRWKTEGNWSPHIINLGDRGSPPSVADVCHAVAELVP
ncbi:MAG: lipopolysaccharide heptosyltransferase I [Pseudomonadota bacterium]|nr:lipopolysaccharide heptosyltransferase I [Pseudomonadota bacterium]